MTVPSIKGTAFQSVCDDVEALVADGRVSREQCDARLEARDLEILAEKLNPTGWYPIDTYQRAVELLASVVAPDRTEAYLIERGERAAERLSALGIYSQLEATTENLGVRIGNMIVTLAGAIYNFGEWRFRTEPDEAFSICVENAAAMPEVARFATQGFVQWVATHAAGQGVRVTSSRPEPSTVVYRGTPAG